VNPGEKIVIFTTYLGSVDTLRRAIESRFPGAGVEVIKGGDHGAKVAAERRFKRPTGPRVLICTAAGREGINLQFARVLFNHDLPWNPMDVEQRIGRIHRYGQAHTAQVYSLVSADTIEGQIFLLLEDKLLMIAKALGKTDEHGQVAEDLRGQILGQLSERLSYDKLYQDAVLDPTLRRTRAELEVAVENATTARRVVSELFQDLEGFRLDEYRAFDDAGKGMERLLTYFREGIEQAGREVLSRGPGLYDVSIHQTQVRITTRRDLAKDDEGTTLLGLEHPLVRRLMAVHAALEARGRALAAGSDRQSSVQGVLTIWRAQMFGVKGQYQQRVVVIGLSREGERSREIEQLATDLRRLRPHDHSTLELRQRLPFVSSTLPAMVRRELEHSGALGSVSSCSLRLLGWIELA
jgi:hypothetical protein